MATCPPPPSPRRRAADGHAGNEKPPGPMPGRGAVARPAPDLRRGASAGFQSQRADLLEPVAGRHAGAQPAALAARRAACGRVCRGVPPAGRPLRPGLAVQPPAAAGVPQAAWPDAEPGPLAARLAAAVRRNPAGAGPGRPGGLLPGGLSARLADPRLSRAGVDARAAAWPGAPSLAPSAPRTARLD